MPSGSKKRKSSKKPKPSSQGEPPELETGFEEGMAKDGEETGEGPPSPKTTEGDPEAMAEGGLEAKEINGEILQEEHVEPEEIKEGSLAEAAFALPHQQENCDPPSQVDPEPDIQAVLEGDAPARIEPEEEAPIEIGQGEPLLQIKPEIDTPLVQTDTATDAEIKREMEMDAVPIAHTDAAPDAPADEFKPEADIGQDEIELSIESASVERELEPSAPPIVSQSRMDESSVKTAPEDAAPTASEGDADAAPDAPDEFKPEADIGQDEIELSIESAPVERESEPSAPPVVSESRMDESPVETAPEDAAPTVFEGDTGAAPDAPADEFKSEADNGQDEIELSIESALVERESEPAVSESRMDESPVETAPANIEPEIDKAPVGTEAVMDAAPAEVEPEIDEAPVEMKPETDALPANIEPETDETPVEIEPETDGAPADISPEMEGALVEREPEMDAAAADVEPETDTAPADSELEADVAQVETDAFPVEVQPEINAAGGPGIETQADAAAREIETDLLEMEPETEATPSEIKPEVNAASIDTEQDEVAQAEIKLEPEPEVEALPEVQAEEEVESLDTSLEIEAEMEPPQEIEREPKPEPEEPPQEIEPEPKSEPEEPPQEIESEAKAEAEDPSEDASLEIEAKNEPPQEIEPEPEVEAVEDASLEIEAKREPLQEIEPEPDVEAVEEAKPDDEELAEIKADDKTSAEAELGEQDLVEGEVGASLETNPEPEVGASHEIDPEGEAEAEVSLDAEQKPEMEALAEAKSDEKGSFETESDQQDLVEIEPEHRDVQEHDEQENIVDAPEVPVIEDELGDQVEPVHDEQEHIADAPEVPVIADELGDQVELPAISASDGAILVDDSIPVIEASIDTDNEGPGNEQEFLGKPDEAEDISPSAVVLEGEGQGTKEGVSDDQDPGADLEQDRETAVDNEQGVLDELADASKEDIDEQQRAGDDGPDDDQSVLASVGDGSETAVTCEQELGIELPLADAIAVEECATEGALLNDQMLVTEQPQLSIDEQELLGAADEPPSAESELVEQGLETILPSPESEMTLDPYEPKDEAVTSADKEKVAFERDFNLESSSGELERDIGEEEAASSTVAEAGSVLNDFDENAHYEHELHTDFPSYEHIPDSRDFDDTLSPKAPEAGLEEQLDSEPYPTKQQRFITESNGNEVKPLASEGDSLTDEVDLRVGQGLGNPCEQAEVLLESADAAEAAEELHASFVEELPDDVQPLARPEQVVQESEEDKVHISKEGLAADKELRLVEEERAACEDGEGAATAILGVGSAKEFTTIAENELMSKALTTGADGQYSLSRSEAPSNDLLDLRDESIIHHSDVNNMDEAEIHAVEAKELQGAELNLVGGDSSDDASKAPVQSVSSDPEGRDIGIQAFRQESTQEASLPVVVPAQDRALGHVNPKTSGGAILEGRKKWLGCCGMFDVLLGKN